MIWHAYAPAPIGNLLLIADEEGLLRIEFPPASPPDEVSLDEERLMPVIRQIGEFFFQRFEVAVDGVANRLPGLIDEMMVDRGAWQ